MVVGSDGTPASLVTVGHAAGVAAAADADLFVVSAYNPRAGSASSSAAAGGHQELYGEEAAREAARISIKELKKERARNIDYQIVPGNPAEALLEVAGDDPTNLIVVGNRGLGAAEGEALGSIPREVVKRARGNVMIVRTDSEGNRTSTQGAQTPGGSD